MEEQKKRYCVARWESQALGLLNDQPGVPLRAQLRAPTTAPPVTGRSLVISVSLGWVFLSG